MKAIFAVLFFALSTPLFAQVGQTPIFIYCPPPSFQLAVTGGYQNYWACWNSCVEEFENVAATRCQGDTIPSLGENAENACAAACSRPDNSGNNNAIMCVSCATPSRPSPRPTDTQQNSVAPLN